MRRYPSIGALLLAAVAGIAALFLVFFVWFVLFPKQVDALELGVLLILLQIPIAGAIMGPMVLLIYSELRSRRVVPGSRVLTRPRAAGSAGTPVVFFATALIPGCWSAWLIAVDRDTLWERIVTDPSNALFILMPVALTVSFLACGINAMIRRRDS